jgi:hypothetical protein
MKNLILSMMAISLLTTNFFAQAKPILEYKYFDKYRSALDATEKLKRRIETKEIEYKTGNPSKNIDMVLEIIDTKNRRFTKITKEDSNVNQIQFVMFNSKVYKRENNGKWLKGIWDDGGKFRVSAGKSENKIETIKVDNKDITLLTSLTNIWEGESRFVLDIIWIDQNNRLLKEEFSFGSNKTKEVDSIETKTYFYDSKIVINNPISKSQNKK